MATTNPIPPVPSFASSPFRKPRRRARAGVALVLVLAFLVLLAGIVVAVLTVSTTERSSAGLTLQRTQAELLADATVDSVMGTISDAIKQGSQTDVSAGAETSGHPSREGSGFSP